MQKVRCWAPVVATWSLETPFRTCRMIHPDAAATGGAGACAYHHCPACAENMRPEALAQTANFAPVLVAEVVTSNNDTAPLVVGATCSPMPRSAAHNQHHNTAALQCRRLRRCQNPGCNVPLSCVHAGMAQACEGHRSCGCSRFNRLTFPVPTRLQFSYSPDR